MVQGKKIYVHAIIVISCGIKKMSPDMKLSISCIEISYTPVHNEANLYLQIHVRLF